MLILIFFIFIGKDVNFFHCVTVYFWCFMPIRDMNLNDMIIYTYAWCGGLILAYEADN